LDKYFKLALKLSKSESTISGSTGFFWTEQWTLGGWAVDGPQMSSGRAADERRTIHRPNSSVFGINNLGMKIGSDGNSNRKSAFWDTWKWETKFQVSSLPFGVADMLNSRYTFSHYNTSSFRS
jgi:hypothetical protein